MAKYLAAAAAALFVTVDALELTADNFEAEIKGSKNSLVKFQVRATNTRAVQPLLFLISKSPANASALTALDDSYPPAQTHPSVSARSMIRRAARPLLCLFVFLNPALGCAPSQAPW